MAKDRSAKALAAVERTLKRNKNATPEQIRKVAEKADASIKKLDGRTFHASYALPSKKKLGLTKPPRRRKKTTRRRSQSRSAKKRSGRALARQLVLERDKEVRNALVAGKSDPQAAYDLGAGVDDYLDELQQALGT